MTESERDKRVKLFEKQNGKCFYCGQPANQFAHILGQTKLNYKLYGEFVIDSEYNGVLCCSLECNKKADIGKISLAVLEHIIEVYQKELERLSG